MKCYLCGLEAKVAEEAHGGELIDCSDCGIYRISGLVLKELTIKKINFTDMRDDLHRQRQFNSTEVAEINTETVIWA
ncbi:hypothetical protein [Pseudomonas sp. TSRC2-2]|uniref:hypothetical protein n=1 Tax=Pseudomonas sp. TSRC2-2 TaxID=2804571 RepID=UPI003CF864BC